MPPTRPMDDPELRALRLALAVSAAVPHPSACRLALEAPRWWDATVPRARDLAIELGLPPTHLTTALGLRRRARRLADAAVHDAATRGLHLLTRGDPGFPAAFADLDLPPPAIWIRGELPVRPAVAIVGARRASRYGLEIASWLAAGAAAGGALVVSGFALGVDAAAHAGALSSPGGVTVAVLGCGTAIDYPRGHRSLGERIAGAGGLLTEFPPDCEPRPWQFPVRNRLIAALARAVVVVEAAPRSGSLVTARLALELGRDLLAVPGRVTDELALGPNALLADGAAPALTPGDLLGALGLERSTGADELPIQEPAGLTGLARTLWRAAADRPATAEELAATGGETVARTLAVLLDLELAGHLRRQPDGRYAPV